MRRLRLLLAARRARRRRPRRRPPRRRTSSSPRRASRSRGARKLVDQAVEAAPGRRPRAGATSSRATPTSTTSSSPRCRCACATRTSSSTSSSRSPSSATGSATAPRSRSSRSAERDRPRARRRRPGARRPGVRGAAHRLRLLVQHPLPRGARGGAADRDPARLARGGPGERLPHARSPGACWPRCSRRAITWVLATLVLDIAPVQRELLEGVTALVAVGVLFVVTLLARLATRAAATGSSSCGRASRPRSRRAARLAFAGLGFTAVYREGFETVLFYQALTIFAEGLLVWVAARDRRGGARPRGRRLAVFELGKRLPVKPLLTRRRDPAPAALGRLRRQRRALAAVERRGSR